MKKVNLFISVLFILLTAVVNAQFTNLHNFNDTAGSFPISSLTLGGSVFYGITGTGGDTACNCGCIFSINANGTGFNDMHNFLGSAHLDGTYPVGNLALVGNRLYGLTNNGQMTTNGNSCTTCGTMFAINTDGSGYSALYNFGDVPGTNCATGCQPSGSLTYSDTVFYGMAGGGPTDDGVIFVMDTSGAWIDTLMSFNGANGSMPTGALTLSGNVLYGMTSKGGSDNQGSVFKINTNGTGFDTLMSFNGPNGSTPIGSLTLSGNVLYGMTEDGGSYTSGRIFSINTNGTGYADLFDFNDTLGASPQGDLTLAGNVLYGMTSSGGALSYGDIFSINTNGANMTDLFDFCLSTCNDTTGTNPEGDLILYGNALYGMDYGGGLYNAGVIFKLDTNSITSINELTIATGAVNLYPNPNNGKLTISLALPTAVTETLPQVEIYNVLGEIVYHANIATGNSQISLSNPVPGFYLYRIVSHDGKLTGEGKFVVE